MGNIFKKVIDAYKYQMDQGERLKTINKIREEEGFRPLLGDEIAGDARYHIPKQDPKASEELVEETIENTEIYKRAKEHILNAQKKQVAYGLDKYPEPLNADTWSMIESIDHIIDESVDRLHYLVMLRIQLERQAEKEENSSDTIDKINLVDDQGTKYCIDDVELSSEMLKVMSQSGVDFDGDICRVIDSDLDKKIVRNMKKYLIDTETRTMHDIKNKIEKKIGTELVMASALDDDETKKKKTKLKTDPVINVTVNVSRDDSVEEIANAVQKSIEKSSKRGWM